MIHRVSVCIPVYNGVKYIEETINSILQQSMPDFELIISDNYSTDGTYELAQNLSAKDKRLNVRRNAENIGYSKNILEAVRSARSELVAIFHADDVYHPEILIRELNVLESCPTVAGVFTHPAVFKNNINKASRRSFYKGLHKRGLYTHKRGLLVGSYKEFRPILLEFGNIFACPSFMTRKSDFLSLGGFKDRYPSNEDLELWIKYLRSGRDLAIVDDFLMYYRISDDHASAFWKSRPELSVMYTVFQDLIIAEDGLSSKEKSAYQRNIAVGYARAALNAARQGDKEKARDLASLSRRSAVLYTRAPWFVLQYFPNFVVQLFQIVDSITYYRKLL